VTDLRRIIRRRCAEAESGRRRRLVVTLYPGDVIGFREYRGRLEWTASLEAVYQTVVRWNVEAERRAWKAARRGGKGGT